MDEVDFTELDLRQDRISDLKFEIENLQKTVK